MLDLAQRIRLEVCWGGLDDFKYARFPFLVGYMLSNEPALRILGSNNKPAIVKPNKSSSLPQDSTILWMLESYASAPRYT